MNRIVFLIVFFLGFNTTAQTNKKLDSLLSVNQRYVKEDTVKINLLVSLSDVYQEINLEKAMEKSTQAVALAKQLKYPFWLARAYEENASNLMYSGKFDQSVVAYDEAIKIYTALGDKKKQIRMANNLGNVYYLSRNFMKAREFYEKAANEAEKIGDKSTQAKALCNAGNVYDKQLEYAKSIASFEKGINLFEQLGDQKSVARNVGNLGITYIHMNNYKKALDSFFKAKKANEAMNNKSDLANNLINIAYIYAIFKDTDNELKYTEKALTIYESIGNKISTIEALNNIGGTYYRLNDFLKSITFHTRALELSKEIKSDYHIMGSLVSLIGNYGELKEYSKAFEYYQQLKAFDKKSMEPLRKMSVLAAEAYLLRISPDVLIKANGYLPENRYALAEELATAALNITREVKDKVEETKKLNDLSLVYEKKGDFKKAYDTHKQVIELQKQLDGEDLKKQITRKEAEYEFDKKEAELIFQQKLTAEQLEKQKIITAQREQSLLLNTQELKLKNQALSLSEKDRNLQRLAYLKEKAEKQEKEQALLLADKDKKLKESELSILLKEKALQIQALAQKNATIGFLIASLLGLILAVMSYILWQRQKTLKQDKTNSMNFTKQLLENTEVERKRIATDLHDSISHELLNLKSIFKQDLTTVNTKIDTIINDIRGISRNLHPVMFDKIGLESNIEQLVERTQEQNDFMVSTDINYKGSLSSADELQIYRIIQEALTNIIKYAKAHAGKITMEENKERIFIEIKDNGKGFNVKEALNSGKSFGLHNIIERSRVIGGEAKISSSTEGTVIHLNIPKKV
jgi:signal transduction histidine kinase/tetratricopeptide (TPR) repeat protein